MKRLTTVAGVTLAMLVAGCASPDYRAPVSQPVPQAYPGAAYPGAVQPPAAQPVYSNTSQPYTVAYGQVVSIQPVTTQGSSGPGLGTVAGGVAGGLLGSQVGSGRGKTAATVAGAVGGAAVGQHLQNRGGTAYQIGVRLDNGNFVTVTQDTAANLQVGSRVRIDSNNRVYPY